MPVEVKKVVAERILNLIEIAKGGEFFAWVWYQRAKRFIESLMQSLTKIDEDDFYSALFYWQDRLLPLAPIEVRAAAAK